MVASIWRSAAVSAASCCVAVGTMLFGMGAPAGAQTGNGNPPANSNAGGNGNAPATSNAGGNANSNAGGHGNAPPNSNAGGNSAGGNGNAGPGGGSASTSGGGNAPPGNNGTIKIDEFTMDPGNDNDTHLPCGGFSVSFFGYDGGSAAHTGVIYVTPWAPTSGGTKGTFGPFTVTPAGWTRTSGNQFDANYTVSWTQLAPLFAGVAPAAQGYHVRIEVEVTGSQGADDKFKMAWLTPCAPLPTPGGPGPVGGTPPPTPPTSPTTPPTPPTSPATAGVQAASVLPTTLTTSNLPLTGALPSTAGLSGDTTSPPRARLVGALAFTGLVLLPILGGGLLLSGIGTLLVRWSRGRHRAV